jgi:hypothetical protein
MRTYGQYCPIARGAEIFAERWTPLIVRNLHLGARTFTDIHGGVPLRSDRLAGAPLLDAAAPRRRRSLHPPPGLDEDLVVTTDVETLALIHSGPLTVTDVIRNGRCTVIGPADLVRAFPGWGGKSPFAGVPAARPTTASGSDVAPVP